MFNRIFSTQNEYFKITLAFVKLLNWSFCELACSHPELIPLYTAVYNSLNGIYTSLITQVVIYLTFVQGSIILADVEK